MENLQGYAEKASYEFDRRTPLYNLAAEYGTPILSKMRIASLLKSIGHEKLKTASAG